MKLPAFESLDEKRKAAWCEYNEDMDAPTDEHDYNAGFESGVIERDKMWQSKVSKLLDAMESRKCDEVINADGSGMFNKHDPNCRKCSALAEFYSPTQASESQTEED